VPFGDYTVLCVALAAAGLAGFLRGLSGFGSSLLLAPVLSILWPPIEATAITLLIGISASFVQVPRYIARIEITCVLPMIFAGLMFLFPGAWLLKLLASGTMKHVMGYAVLAITLSMAWPRISFRESRTQSVIAGALGGLIMGATSMGGPPLVLYLLGRNGDPQQLKANVVVTVGVIELGAFVGVVLLGQVNLATLARFAVLLPGFWLGIHLSRIAAEMEAGRNYRYLLLGLLLMTGLASVIL
jgi:uncharacterized membrane protein YfcA